jgi:hypothetical protein
MFPFFQISQENNFANEAIAFFDSSFVADLNPPIFNCINGKPIPRLDVRASI